VEAGAADRVRWRLEGVVLGRLLRSVRLQVLRPGRRRARLVARLAQEEADLRIEGWAAVEEQPLGEQVGAAELGEDPSVQKGHLVRQLVLDARPRGARQLVEPNKL
jgi:hypothetical protein